MPAEYAVIGLGQFGQAVVESLTEDGQAVLVIDRDPARVEALATTVDAAAAADATDEESLRQLGVPAMTSVVVAIGAGAVESSILTTALLRQLGVPRIVARAVSTLHARVLHAVGAHEVVNPEEEMGRRLAERLAHPTIRERLQLGDAVLAEVDTPARFVGRSLKQLNVRARHGVSVVAVRSGADVVANPPPDRPFAAGDVVLVVGTADSVRALARLA